MSAGTFEHWSAQAPVMKSWDTKVNLLYFGELIIDSSEHLTIVNFDIHALLYKSIHLIAKLEN